MLSNPRGAEGIGSQAGTETVIAAKCFLVFLVVTVREQTSKSK
jgi:hypothetical protein